MTMQGDKTLNKNFLIAAGVLLVIGFAVAVGVTLSTEPLTAGLPEGETTVTGDPLPTYSGENDDNIAIGLSVPECLFNQSFNRSVEPSYNSATTNFPLFEP